MIQKNTWINVTDNTTVNWLQIFHLYKGFNRHASEEGYFVKGSARSVKPPRVEYKGFKFKYNTKGDICRGLLVRTKFPNLKSDGSVLYFHQNSCILIKKNKTQNLNTCSVLFHQKFDERNLKPCLNLYYKLFSCFHSDNFETK